MSTPNERMQAAGSARMLGVLPLGDGAAFDFVHIADLIDPTCHAELVTVELPNGIGRYVRCSECHAVWREPSRVRYCPNCGARRTYDDATVANETEDE